MILSNESYQNSTALQQCDLVPYILHPAQKIEKQLETNINAAMKMTMAFYMVTTGIMSGGVAMLFPGFYAHPSLVEPIMMVSIVGSMSYGFHYTVSTLKYPEIVYEEQLAMHQELDNLEESYIIPYGDDI